MQCGSQEAVPTSCAVQTSQWRCQPSPTIGGSYLSGPHHTVVAAGPGVAWLAPAASQGSCRTAFAHRGTSSGGVRKVDEYERPGTLSGMVSSSQSTCLPACGGQGADGSRHVQVHRRHKHGCTRMLKGRGRGSWARLQALPRATHSANRSAEEAGSTCRRCRAQPRRAANCLTEAALSGLQSGCMPAGTSQYLPLSLLRPPRSLLLTNPPHLHAAVARCASPGGTTRPPRGRQCQGKRASPACRQRQDTQ